LILNLSDVKNSKWKKGVIFVTSAGPLLSSVQPSPSSVTLTEVFSDKVLATIKFPEQLKPYSFTVIEVRADRKLAATNCNGHVQAWNLADGTLIHNIDGHSENATDIAFANDGVTIASASMDHTIKLWDLETGELKTTLLGHVEPVYDIEFSRAKDQLFSVSQDSTIRLWDGRSPDVIPNHKVEAGELRAAPNAR
jgi:WD40 repeat protein